MDRFLIRFLIVLMLVLSAGVVVAQEGMTPVAESLTFPRGLFTGEDGTLYIAIPGAGGELTAVGVRGNEGQFGGTAQVVAVAPDGTQSVPVSGFPSYFAMGEATGVSDVHIANNLMWIATGQGPRVASDNTNNPISYAVVAVDPGTGRMAELIDLYAYEAENNPAGDTIPDSDTPLIDSNVVSLDTGADGTLYIADAGANTVYSWTPDGGLQVFATYPDNPVPTAVSVGPNGNVFIGFLTSFPFAQGSARIEERSPAGEVVNTYEGLTTVVDVLATDSGIYAVSISNFDPEAQGLPWVANSGSVMRLSDGGMEVVAEGLNFPYGITMNSDGNLLVSVNSAFVEPGTGAVMMLDGGM